MTYTVEFTATARADLQAILEFIARDNPYRALSFVDELQERLVQKLETFPESGAMIGDFRYVVLNRYIPVRCPQPLYCSVFARHVPKASRDRACSRRPSQLARCF